jgi:hypothetical protein
MVELRGCDECDGVIPASSFYGDNDAHQLGVDAPRGRSRTRACRCIRALVCEVGYDLDANEYVTVVDT